MLINYKDFQLQRIDRDIEKYSTPPLFDENLGNYFDPKNCKLCVAYKTELGNPKMFNSLCSMCIFSIPLNATCTPGCLAKFPSYRSLIGMFSKVLRSCVLGKPVNEDDKSEFLRLWAYRKGLFLKIKKIIAELPDDRFTESGFKFFPEIWELDNA